MKVATRLMVIFLLMSVVSTSAGYYMIASRSFAGIGFMIAGLIFAVVAAGFYEA